MIVDRLIMRHHEKTTLAGLREAFNAIPPKPPPLSFAEYAALPCDDRDAYDEAREDFVRLSLRVPTPEQDACARILARLTASNPRRKNSRRGLMISAPLFYGKTELALLLSRSIEHDHAARHPQYIDDGVVPVVWVEMTDHATGKGLLAQVIRFLAPTVVLPARITTEELRRLTVEALDAHRTKLLVIDEAHNLAGGEPSSVIKALQNESSVTVVLVGINLDSGKAFGSGDGLQVTMRCEMIELRKADINTAEGLAMWRRWVAIFDRNLPLCDHTPGLLTRNALTLHKAAGGQLAVLAMMIERLVAGILTDAVRNDELVSRQKLFSVLDALRQTTPIRHRIKIEDLTEAA